MSNRARCTLIALVVGAAPTLGCGSDEPSANSLAQQLCARADECNFLPAGVSIQDCTDEGVMCLDDLVSSERQDWSDSVRACLDKKSCSNFDDCYGDVPDC